MSATLAIGSGGTNATTAAGARTNLGATGKYAQTFGDGSATSYVITHNLNSTDVIVQVSYVATPFQVVECEKQLTSTNTITLLFGSAPASNSLRVVVIGKHTTRSLPGRAQQIPPRAREKTSGRNRTGTGLQSDRDRDRIRNLPPRLCREPRGLPVTPSFLWLPIYGYGIGNLRS